MLRNKIILYLFTLAFLSACIKPFTPKIDTVAISKVVVSGKVTNQEGYQIVSLSKSTPLNITDYEPYSGNQVSIWDENGNEFVMNEYKSGEYRVWMHQQDLKIGTAYHIRIITPEGDELKSESEVMTNVAAINIPNYSNDSIYNGAYKYYSHGIQFHIDVDGDETTSRYYLFELEDTYEHHAPYAREWYYDGRVHHIFPPDSSLLKCWTTERVPEILTLSTENLTANKFHNFNLNFVSLRGDYLTYGYSLLIRQVGLSRKAFIYWESVRLNNNQNASLYSKQPVDTQGNIKNLTHPEKEVLGFFSASATSEVRIFIQAMKTIPYPPCYPETLDYAGFREIGREFYPAFLLSDYHGGYYVAWLHIDCVDCSARHGTTVKPDFWPY